MTKIWREGKICWPLPSLSIPAGRGFDVRIVALNRIGAHAPRSSLPLRHPTLISVGLPFAISVLAFLLLYNALTNGVPWFLSIAIVGGTIAVPWVAELGMSRLLKRFIRA
jgi:hypothetical protein